MNPIDFTLQAAPAPSIRAEVGSHQRSQLAYQWRNIAYDAQEQLIRCWKAHRNKLPRRAAEILGVATVAAALRILRPALQGMMRVLGVKRPSDLLARYGRNGENSWCWDHRQPLRFANHFDESQKRKAWHISNLWPRLACRNKARKFEPPVDHPELFAGKEQAK